MIINKDGKIIGTTTKVIKEFETVEEYNNWLATIEDETTLVCYDIRKKWESADVPKIIMEANSSSFPDIHSLSKNQKIAYFLILQQIVFFSQKFLKMLQKNLSIKNKKLIKI